MVIGLFIGLGLSAIVAFMVMRSPAPFVDRASRAPSTNEQPTDPRSAPDPNAALGGGSASSPASSSSPAPTKDELGALIATLPIQANKPPQLPPAPVSPAPISPITPPSAAAKPESGDARGYYLQVGAFRVLEDAESLRARVLLLGLPVEIQRAEVNGMQVNRVRVGPFAKLDEMNKARSRLGEEKIVTTVVRQ